MFLKAKPVWVKGKENKVHMMVQFKCLCPQKSGAVLRVATSGIYNLRVNGRFVAYGPARAGKNHFRMDEIDLSAYLTQPQNAVVLEVCGYNTLNFYLQKQPSFVQAEIVAEGTPLCWTGEHFTARLHPFARRKTQRYSYQRPMIEAYTGITADTFLTDEAAGTLELAVTEEKCIISRNVPYPAYEVIDAVPLFSGTVSPKELETPWMDRGMTDVSDELLTGFPVEELEVVPTVECQRMAFTPVEECTGGQLKANTYTTYKLPYNATGMLKWRLTCTEPMTLYVLFDEVLSDGRVDFLRMNCANAFRYDFEPGAYELQTFEVYTMQYVQMTAVGGSCTIENLSMVEYKHPPVSKTVPADTPALQQIRDAALETFRQNAVDLYTDCPSRERAGWLCDSFFTGRVEKLLTGGSTVEKNFLENFLHEEHYTGLPEGMVPMCYPSDHRNGSHIPQWSMWLLLELEEYAQRSGDRDLIDRFRPRVDGLLRYFAGFENKDGLLEKLPGWNFVEWSKANDLVWDVNYPTNMLYAASLCAVANLYDQPQLKDKAARILQTVREQSFDGQFFVDNAVRQEDGSLKLSGERTEVCQYYAFFFGAAQPDTHKELLDILIRDFGPDREQTGKWPEIYPANAFIGNYLRLDILMQLGYRDEVKSNIEGYFLYMAERTGTLWENVGAYASCDHGFASYVLYWMNQLAQG